MLDPFIRVRHSKKAIVEDIVNLFPKSFQRFVDATPTDLSVLSAQPRSPKRTIIQAPNPELTLLIEAITGQWEHVVAAAEFLWEDTSREEFESVAASDMPADPAEAAAQVLYLNQLCRTGTSSYDPGHKAAQFEWNLLGQWSEELTGIKTAPEHPLSALETARETDLVYVDGSTDLGLEAAAEVARTSAGMVALLDPAPEEVHELEGFTAHVLPRKRPGLRHPDVLHVNW